MKQEPLIRRVRAAQAAVDRYRDKTLVWGRRDCAQMVNVVLKRLGHDMRLSRFGRYASAATAKRAMRRQGISDLQELMDEVLGAKNRIAQAEALPADVLGFWHPDRDVQPFGTALAVSVGNGNMLCFYHDGVCRVGPPTYFAEGGEYLAWRCNPA